MVLRSGTDACSECQSSTDYPEGQFNQNWDLTTRGCDDIFKEKTTLELLEGKDLRPAEVEACSSQVLKKPHEENLDVSDDSPFCFENVL